MSITAAFRDEDDAPPCRGCTRAPIVNKASNEYETDVVLWKQDNPVAARYFVGGDDFGGGLCLPCALKLVEALAAVIMMRSPEGKRELLRFFDVTKKKAKVR